MEPTDPYVGVAGEVAADAGLRRPSVVRRLSGGIANHVYCLDERHVVRLGTGPDGRCFPQSAAVLAAVTGRMAAPRLLHVDLTQRRYPFNVMVCEYVAGRSLYDLWGELDQQQRLGLLAQVPRELDVLHAVTPGKVAIFADAPSWAQGMRRALTRRFDQAQGHAETRQLQRMRRYVEDHWWAMQDAPPTVILHNDVHWNNIIVRDGRMVALIDFDDAELGPAEIDAWSLAHLLAYSDRPDDPTPLSRPEAMRAAFAFVRRIWPTAMSHPGAVERYTIRHIHEILCDLTDPPPWHTAAETREETMLVYQALFEGPGAEYWLNAP